MHFIETKGIQAYEAVDLPCEDYLITARFTFKGYLYILPLRKVYLTLPNKAPSRVNLNPHQRVKIEDLENIEIESIRDENEKRTHTLETMMRNPETGDIHILVKTHISVLGWEKVLVWKLIRSS